MALEILTNQFLSYTVHMMYSFFHFLEYLSYHRCLWLSWNDAFLSIQGTVLRTEL